MGACWNPAELSMGEIQGMKKAELVEALLDYFEEELGRRPPLRYSAFLQKQRVSRLRRMLGERLHPQSYPEYRTRAAPTTGGRENPAELSLHEIQGMKKAELVKAILSFTQAPIVMGKGAKAYLQKQRVSKLQRMLALHLHPHAERYRRERYAAWGNPKKPISRMTKKEIIEALLLYAPNLDVVYLAKQRVGSLRDLMKKAEAWERSSPARKMSPRLKAVLRRKRQDYIDRYGHPPPVRARKNARPAWRWGAGDPESHALGGRLPNAPREAVERFAEVRDIGESVKDLQFQLSRVQGKKQKHERQRSDLRRAIDSANRDLESVQREVRDEILEKYDYDKSDKVGNQAATALRSVFFQSVRSNPVNYHIEDRWMANPSRRPPLRLFGGGGRKKRTSCTELERRRLEHELKVCASFVPQHPPPISVRMAANPSVFERWGGMGQQTAFTGTGGTIKQLIAARSWFLPFSLGGVDDPEMGESVMGRIIGEISDEPKRRRDIAKELREEEADRVRVSDYYSRLKPKQDAYLKDHYPQFSGLLLGY